MYQPQDILALLCRSLQPITLPPELEGTVLKLEITKITHLNLIVSLGKIQPYYGLREATIILKGTLSQWLELMYHQGQRTSIDVSGDISKLQQLRTGIQEGIFNLSLKMHHPSFNFLHSLLYLLHRELGVDDFLQKIWISTADLEEAQKNIFDIYYQVERIEQKIAHLLSVQN